MLGFIIASGLTALCFAVHTFVGSREVTRPLFDSAIPAPEKYIVFLCWHLVTVVFAVMAFGFLWAAFGAWQVGVICTVLAAGMGGWALLLQRSSGQPFKALPQWSLLLAMALAGLWGAVAHA